MTIKEAILAWAHRTARHDNIAYDHLVILSDGFIYAMPADQSSGAVAWWPLPYLGPEGEQAFASGELTDDN